MNVHIQAVLHVLAGALFLAAPLFAADTRPLTVTVMLLDPDGDPVAGSELLVRSGLNPEQQFKCSETNAEGIASLTLSVDQSESSIYLIFSAGGDPDVSGSVRAARRERFWHLLSQYALPSWTRYSITPDQAVLSISIQLKPGITVRGRAVDAAGHAIEGIGVFARNHPRWGSDEGNGQFLITGIERGSSAEIYLTSDAMTVPIQLEATRTLNDIDLGDMQIPSAEGNADVQLTLDHAGWTPHFLETPPPGIALISDDGQHIWSFSGDQQGRALAHQSPHLTIPPGTYYLIPGCFTPDRPVHLAALDLVCSGQAASVLGWPKLVAVSGQNDEITINAAAVDQAIMQAAGKQE